MARNFNELRNKMSPERRARVNSMTREMMVEMLLAEIRQEAGLTQNDLADVQPGKARSPRRLWPDDQRAHGPARG